MESHLYANQSNTIENQIRTTNYFVAVAKQKALGSSIYWAASSNQCLN